MKCPLCRSRHFYVKDPEDAYEIYAFDCTNGSVCFDPGIDPSRIPALDDVTETYCNTCAWHGKLQELISA